MLRVRTLYAHSAGTSARYYTKYGSSTGEVSGWWLGHQADGLDLHGPVGADDLEELLSGHDPATGTRLGSALVDRISKSGKVIPAVAGYDATFSAPKSLSIWWGQTGDPRVLGAHDLAVQAVLDHLEQRGATTRIRVDGKRRFVDTQGLTMAAFRQSTSREDDPQIHTHVVISTKVRSPDGRWYALDARYLKRKQRALGGLYQSVLRAELTHRFGVPWTEIVDGQAEIAHFPAELLERFSKRTEQVDDLYEIKLQSFREVEGRDPTRRERAELKRDASLESRADKTGTPLDELTLRWRAEAAIDGWSPELLVAHLGDVACRAQHDHPPVRLDQILDQVSAMKSTWLPIDVVSAICDTARPVLGVSGQVWAATIERATAEVVATHTDLDPTTTGARRTSDGRSVWVEPIKPNLTHELVLAQEERILSFAIEAQDPPAAPSDTVRSEGLDPLQAHAARAVAGHDRLVLVVGPAGTGKTTALRAAVDDLRRARRPVFGLAPTAKAARVLEGETGMPADTVAKLLYEWSQPNGPRPGYRFA